MKPGYRLLLVLDLALSPFVLVAAILLKFIRRLGLHRMKASRWIFRKVGVLPVRDHYYEPQFVFKNFSFDKPRDLPGIDFHLDNQLELLSKLKYANELADLAKNKQLAKGLEFHFGNMNFESGDAEFLYQMVRYLKPVRIIEIGCGFSTLLIQKAVQRNMAEDNHYRCTHHGIEPFEMPWLEKLPVEVLRVPVESLDAHFFMALGNNDLLFIDSSHMIRPDGDVIHEFLKILPSLQAGVVVHVHDIFTPRHYLKEWVVDEVRFWNEQYLVEAFLTCNPEWEIVAALNLLKHEHYEKLRQVCPYLTADREPGSLYIRRRTP